MSSGVLDNFVLRFWREYHSDKNERQLWEIWLHRTDGEQSYNDWRESIKTATERSRPLSEQEVLDIANGAWQTIQHIKG